MLFFVKGSLFYLFLTLVQRNYIFSDNVRLLHISHALLFLFSFFFLKIMINAYIIYCTPLIDINYILDLRVRLTPTSKIHITSTSHNFDNNGPY